MTTDGRPPLVRWLRRNAAFVALGLVAAGAAAYAVSTLGSGGTAPTDLAATGPGSSSPVAPTVSESTTVPQSSAPTATPPPTTTPPPPPPPVSGFPDASSTGVPAGVSLTPYTGPCTITRDGTVIDARSVDCPLVVKAANVVIKRSFVDGWVATDSDRASLHIEDSVINGGRDQVPALGYRNLTVIRSNVYGGQASVNCAGDCHIEDSWLHGQHLPPGEDWHLDGFLSNGGSNMTLIHNTIACEPAGNSAGGGCTAAAAVFGDFAAITHVTFDGNLFVASEEMSYCLYGGTDDKKPYGRDAHHIRVVNNVFQRGDSGTCAAYGAWTSFDHEAAGNVWSNNIWDDGERVGQP